MPKNLISVTGVIELLSQTMFISKVHCNMFLVFDLHRSVGSQSMACVNGVTTC